ncbi:MAG: autotransporter [Blastococcus sp.]|jgi:hypothetical protein|nr:autotransporter [Blastococcus sp.]
MTSSRCIDPSPTAGVRPSGLARYGAASAAAVVALSVTVLASAGPASAAATPVDLGTAEPFAVLSGAGITNTGATTIGGDIGSWPNPALTVTGSIVLTGTNHRGDNVTKIAKTDLRTAYDAAAAQVTDPGGTISADLAGQTLTPGVYTSATGLAISGTAHLTLDANGDQNAIFLFQSGSTLVTQPNTQVDLVDGASACNVFWQVASSTTLGVDSVFRGNILTQVSTTMNTRARLEGSALSLDGAFTMDSNTIERPQCASVPIGGTSTITNSGSTPPVTPPVTPGGTGRGGAGGATGGAGAQVGRVPVGAVAAGGGGSAAVGRLWSSAF